MSDSMINQFTKFEDLQAFAKAQQKTLVELTKKNKNYEDEIKHLKKLLESTVPIIAPEKSKVDFAADEEENIAREQLFILKQMSSDRELTYEESKKVEIFSKILNAIKTKPKDINAKSKQLSEKELLKLMESQSDDTNFKQ